MPDETTLRQREALEASKGWEPAIAALLETSRQTLAQWRQATNALCEELSTVVEARLRLAAEASSALAACRSPEDLMDCQARLATKVTEHCSTEFARLSQMMTRMAPTAPR